MENRNSRLLVILAAVIVAVAAFVALRPGDDEEQVAAPPAATATPAEPAATPTAGETPTPTPTETATPEPTPEGVSIEVEGGKVVGGVEEIEVKEGDEVEFTVEADVADEVHVHGYDVTRDVEPGKPVKLSFKADITGIFEIELEGAKLELASLKVEP